mmetsp:Transcript_327/g.651  ORF Transcript_327/g.651 Transcript_327/m.651 type:complete len:292 (-) Transcript_327:566-1441(-)
MSFVFNYCDSVMHFIMPVFLIIPRGLIKRSLHDLEGIGGRRGVGGEDSGGQGAPLLTLLLLEVTIPGLNTSISLRTRPDLDRLIHGLSTERGLLICPSSSRWHIKTALSRLLRGVPGMEWLPSMAYGSPDFDRPKPGRPTDAGDAGTTFSSALCKSGCLFPMPKSRVDLDCPRPPNRAPFSHGWGDKTEDVKRFRMEVAFLPASFMGFFRDGLSGVEPDDANRLRIDVAFLLSLWLLQAMSSSEEILVTERKPCSELELEEKSVTESSFNVSLFKAECLALLRLQAFRASS